MRRFLTQKKPILLAGVLLLAALGILMSGREGAGPLGKTIGVIGAPVQVAVSGVGKAIGKSVDHYIFLVGAREESERLRQEVASLRAELMKVEEYRFENERLKGLLAFGERSTFSQVAASVVGRSASAWYRTVILDRGKADGVAPGSPVLTPSGVVGRIYEVGETTSRALLLTDASSAVDALVQRSRDQVLLEGDMTPNPRLLYLTRGSDVKVGDKIITSGLDGIYPKGLILGEVGEVTEEPGEFFLTASLEPTVDFARLEEVFIVKGGEAGKAK